MIITNMLSHKIVAYISGDKPMRDTTKEIYTYCVSYLLEQLLFLLSLLVFGIVTKQITFFLLFYLLFTGFRFTSGGYHAPKPWICNMFSYSSAIFVFASAKIIPNLPPMLLFFLSCIFAAIIVALSPIDNPKKKLDNNHKQCLRLKCSLFASIVIILQFLLCYANQQLYCKLIMSTCFLSILSLFGGIYTNYR